MTANEVQAQKCIDGRAPGFLTGSTLVAMDSVREITDAVQEKPQAAGAGSGFLSLKLWQFSVRIFARAFAAKLAGQHSPVIGPEVAL